MNALLNSIINFDYKSWFTLFLLSCSESLFKTRYFGFSFLQIVPYFFELSFQLVYSLTVVLNLISCLFHFYF